MHKLIFLNTVAISKYQWGALGRRFRGSPGHCPGESQSIWQVISKRTMENKAVLTNSYKGLFIHFHREEKELVLKRLLKFMYTGFNYELFKYISTNKSNILKTYEKFKCLETLFYIVLLWAPNPLESRIQCKR